MRALSILVAVTCALGACKSSNPPARKVAPPTLAEAEAFAKDFASKMSPCSATALNDALDFDMVITRAVAGRNIPGGAVKQIKREAPSIGGKFCSQLSEASYTYLRTQMIDGAPQPLFRVITGTAVNYHQLELDKHNGTIRAADIYLYATGERLSDTFGKLFDSMIETSVREAGESMQRVQRLVAAGKHDEALAALKAMPEKLRTSKPLMLMEVQISSNVNDDTKYLAAIEAYGRAFPNDPSLDLVMVDGAYLRKEWAEVHRLVDKLEQRVGGDPYLELLRAEALGESGKRAEAIASAKKATEAEPTLEQAWWQLMTQQSAAQDFAGAVATLGVLSEKFDADVTEDTLRSDERFGGLVESAEFAAHVGR